MMASGLRGHESRGAPLVKWLALVPLVAAAVGLALPTVIASADVAASSGRFVASWPLLGWESVSGLAALALAALAVALAHVERPVVPASIALAACAAWAWLADVPMHVLTAGLAPDIEQYYGTEHGSIVFRAAWNPASITAVVLAACVLVIVIAVAPRRAATRRHGAGNER
jgi:hypothetical protein